MFKFNPQTDDIEEFVRNVQETATQLNYGNEAVANIDQDMHAYGHVYKPV